MKASDRHENLTSKMRWRAGMSRLIAYGVLSLAALAITFHTHASWRRTSEQFLERARDVESLSKVNGELQTELNQLRNDPKIIESIARQRLNMVQPADVVPTLYDHSFLKEETSAQLNSQAISQGSRLLTYALPVLYCVGAIIGGFIAAKGLIALLVLYSPSWSLFPLLHCSEKNHRGDPVRTFNKRSHLIWLLLSGLLITAAFVFAANKRFAEITLKERTEDLRTERKRLIDENHR